MKAVVFDYNRTIFDPDTNGLMPGALDVLKLLHGKGLKMFMVCKGGEDRKKQIEGLNISHFFEHIVINEAKSSEDFQKCKDMCSPDTMFFAVGDRTREEIRHANNCGMTTIWFKNGKFASEEPTQDSETPKYIVSSLADAAEIILGE